MTLPDRRTRAVVVVLLLAGAGAAACAARPSSPSQTPRAVTWALFVDDLHLDFRNTGRIRDLLRRIGANVIRDGDSFSVTSSGPSNATVPFTTDRTRFEEAVKRVAGNGLRPADFITDDGGHDDLSEVRYRAGKSLSAAQQTIKELASYRGAGRRSEPKAFLYLSNGYFIDWSARGQTAPSASSDRRSIPAPSIDELRARLWSFSDFARRARIKVIAIDARTILPGLDLDLDPSGRVLWPRYVAATRQSLKALTDRTGGLALFEPSSVASPGLVRVSQAMRGGS